MSGHGIPANKWTKAVHHSGRTFLATPTMAAIFAAHATDLRDAGESGLVPLLHSGGVELLFVSPGTAFAIADVELDQTTAARRHASPDAMDAVGSRRAG